MAGKLRAFVFAFLVAQLCCVSGRSTSRSTLLQLLEESVQKAYQRELKESNEGAVVNENGEVDITSINYPENYPSSANQQYTVNAPNPGDTIRVMFNSMDIEADVSCSYDKLVIEEISRKHSYCGNKAPEDYISTTSSIKIIFESDSSVEDKGYSLTVSFIKPETEGSGGISELTSPNYPQDYPPSVEERTVIKAPKDHQRIKLTFTAMDIEYESTCGYDRLTIEDNGKTTKFCGQSLPSPYFSKGNQVVVIFKSDGSYEGSGFRLQIQYLSGPISAPTQVKSPNYPDNYPSNAAREWTVEAPEGKRVKIDFLKFHLEGAMPQCSYDWLEIVDGVDVHKFCGEQNHADFVSKGRTLDLKFTSDSSVEYKGFLIYVDFVDAETGESPKPTCGISKYKSNEKKIVGGEVSRTNEWPWYVSIKVSTAQGWVHNCGAQLISPQWVLTAAHCFEFQDGLETDPQYFQLTLGEHFVNKPDDTESTLNPVKIIVHKNRNDGVDQSHDIALIKLPIAVSMSDDINTICIPDQGHTWTAGTKCVVQGLGHLTSGGSGAEQVRHVEVPIVDKADCQKSYGYGLTQDMLCAGYKEGGKDSCQGDSGGPLVCYDEETERYELAGVVSFGNGCALPGYPGVYADVAHFRPWILATMNEN